MSPTPWLPREPNPNAKAHLLCFPYSGAPPTVFDAWRVPGVDVLPVILPGRGPREGEPLPRSLRGLAEEVAEHLIPAIPGRFSLLGHSMGAWLAHAVATTLGEHGPERLFVLSAPPPHLAPRRFSALHELPDDEMVDEVIRLGGAPDSAREAIRANLPVIRADATAVGEYRPSGRMLTCPITAVCGVDDPLFGLGDLTAWRETTHGPLSVHLVDGGHFTVTGQCREIVRIAARDTGAAAHDGPVAVIGMSCRFPGAGHT